MATKKTSKAKAKAALEKLRDERRAGQAKAIKAYGKAQLAKTRTAHKGAQKATKRSSDLRRRKKHDLEHHSVATSRGSEAAEKLKLMTEKVKRKPVKKIKRTSSRSAYDRHMRSLAAKAKKKKVKRKPIKKTKRGKK